MRTMPPPQAGEPRRVRVASDRDGERLDRLVQSAWPDISRSHGAALIRDGRVTLNGALARPSSAVRTGDAVEVTEAPPVAIEPTAQDIPVAIVYEDAFVAVVDKPAGLSVHPGPGHPDRTLVNALLGAMPGLSSLGGSERPGIVHRLDKDTSGLLAVAKTDAAHRSLTAQLKRRVVGKTYLALVTGAVSRDEGEVAEPIARHPRRRQRMAVVAGGRDALTRYRVVERHPGVTLIEASPVTGRTHQIRVHMAWLGHPLVGDPVYGKRSPLVERHFLHAARLAFWLPPDERERREFESPLPPDLRRALDIARSG